MTDLLQTLQTVGISAFGLGMPVLSKAWTDGTIPTVNDSAMSLSLSTGSWLAPAAGTLTRCETSIPNTTLVGASGTIVTGPGILLTLFPLEVLRLARLYATILEGGTRPESSNGLPLRPVPVYFFYAGALSSSDTSGNIATAGSLGCSGDLTIYDADGMPIDPLAVAEVFKVLMDQHNLLQHRDPVSAAFDATSQVTQIANLAGSTSVVRLRFSSFNGQPFNGLHLTGVTAVTASAGLFTLNATTAGISDLTGTVGLETATGATGSFPDEDRRLLALGPATTGRLGQSFHPPALPTGISLKRDFLSLRVVQLKPFLLGSPNTSFNGASAELRPVVRINEPLNLLADGNDVLAAANTALSGTPTEGLAVAQAIDGGFNLPSATGSAAHWPAFPPLGGVTAVAAGPLAINLRTGFTPTAHYFDDGNPSSSNVDVVLTINGLPAGAAVRVYPRKFVEDAKEARGDGAGGIAPDSGTLDLLLKNPFNFPAILSTPPALPTLRFDMIIVKRTGETRMYGNIAAQVTAATTSGPTASGTNPFGTAVRRGISNAGVLGLGAHALPSISSLSLGEATLTILQALTGETTPRDASRLPSMARRDLLAAGLSGSNWTGVLAGGRLAPEIHSAGARLGSPGGLGGRETQVVGVSSQNARLAYDIARTAFRRTTNIVTRLNDLSGSAWNEPAQPAALAAGSVPTASQGTTAGAVLQTIAPMCETPELGLLKSLVESNLSSIPTSFDALVDWLVGQVNTLAASSAITSSSFLSGIVSNIQTQIITALNNLKDNSTLNESTKERLFNELRRELMAACFGRRDAQWALEGAISNARRFIYIESPAFASTQKDYGTGTVPAYALNLIEKIRTRLTQASGLQVMICTPKFPDFAPGYEAFSAQEAADRRARILGLPPERVVAFHPVGFPGRPSRLESTVVIVDDVWAMVGSSTFRRRGLTFDGGSDLVFTDFDLVKGRSAAIAAFRRKLLADRLGVPAFTTNSFGTMPDPTFIRLADGVEAFYAVREWLVAGGLGKIERLWNGITPGVTAVPPVSLDLGNPDGIEFDLLGTLALSVLTGLNSA